MQQNLEAFKVDIRAQNRAFSETDVEEETGILFI